MSGDRAAEAAFLLLALSLPLSALVVRRLPLGHVARLALLWVAIIVAAALLATGARHVLHDPSSEQPQPPHQPQGQDHAHFT